MNNCTGMHGMGWLRDYPDFRDYSPDHAHIKPLFKKIHLPPRDKQKNGSTVDLREWCSPIDDQGQLGACTAHAAIGVVEYCERKAFGKHLKASRLFLYKTTRNMLHWNGDTGAFLRSTLGALVLFGVPPEEYLEYNTAKFDKEPSPFCYAFAQNYQTIKYCRLDQPGVTRDALLAHIKATIAGGVPAMFGFTVYDSIDQASSTGKIPYPGSGEKVAGGHAVAAFGYDDSMRIKNSVAGSPETRGAFLIRNSWGTSWGDKGYGWLPYEYVHTGLADDWWCILKNEWVETEDFLEYPAARNNMLNKITKVQ
jgi:C1A family cysteine protease